MLNLIIYLVIGLVLTLVGSLLAAIVFGEARKLRHEARTNPSFTKLVFFCAGLLAIVVVITLLLTYFITLWFLLILLPITILSVGIAALNGPNDSAAGSKNRLVTRKDYLAIKARYKEP
jgi:uncharacterized membrane protein